MEGSRVGSWGKPGGGRGLGLDRGPRDGEANGCPAPKLQRWPPGWSRGLGTIRDSALQRGEGPERSGRGPGRPPPIHRAAAVRPRGWGGAGAAPTPPPPGLAAVTRPPYGAPSPSCPLPALPAPGALTWKRFFTHSFFMAGEGAGPAAGRGGDGGGGAESEAGPGASWGAGGSPRGWRKEPPGLGSPGGGKAKAAAAPRARPLLQACTPPGAPTLSCPSASPGAALTCLPARPQDSSCC